MKKHMKLMMCIIFNIIWLISHDKSVDQYQDMFGFVHCNASILARQNTDPNLFFVRTLVKNWLWPIITFFGNSYIDSALLDLVVFLSSGLFLGILIIYHKKFLLTYIRFLKYVSRHQLSTLCVWIINPFNAAMLYYHTHSHHQRKRKSY